MIILNIFNRSFSCLVIPDKYIDDGFGYNTSVYIHVEGCGDLLPSALNYSFDLQSVAVLFRVISSAGFYEVSKFGELS